jgi:hypothetical protein
VKIETHVFGVDVWEAAAFLSRNAARTPTESVAVRPPR